MKHLLYILIISLAVSAVAADYDVLDYERIIDEEYNFSFWSPPGYELIEEEVSRGLYEGAAYKYRWGEGEYRGLKAAVLIVDRQNGLIDLEILKEANDEYFKTAEIEKIKEKPLGAKSLILHDASDGFTVTARFSMKDDTEGLSYDYTALYLQKDVNLFVVSCVSPVEGAKKAKKARGHIIGSFRCSTEEMAVPEKAGDIIKNDRDGVNKDNKDK